MVPLTLAEIATIVGGRVSGDPTVTVTGPTVLDSRVAQPGGMLAAFRGEHVDGHDFAGSAQQRGAVAVLGSRPTVLPTVVVADAERALQALATHIAATLRPDLRVIGVTGSQGKTSTKDLMTSIFSSVAPTIGTLGNLNNELGAPVTITRADASTRYLVLELGARHVGDIALLTRVVAPDVGVVLSVGKAHLGEFGSREAIAQAKGELVEGLAPGGTAVLNADDERVLAMRQRTTGPVLTFGAAAGADVRVVTLRLDGRGRASFDLQTADERVSFQLPHLGAHQAFNAAAAATAALALGVPLETSAAALATSTLSKWRTEVSELPVGATLINDSYNCSPGSALAALDALAAVDGARHIAVMGEILELGDASAAEHRAVGEYARDRADLVLAIGENVRPLATGAGQRAVHVDTNEQAIEWLRRELTAGDVVLVKASRGARLDEVAAALA
jgi:UDP-N-acetylmuramoyl-tripeptide--D-alanyl-D-alanine ligase